MALGVVAGGRGVRFGAVRALDHQKAGGGHAELGVRGRELDLVENNAKVRSGPLTVPTLPICC